MAFFQRCLTAETVDLSGQQKWYKQPPNRTSLRGFANSRKSSNDPTRTYRVEEVEEHKHSQLYHDRPPGGYTSPKSNDISQELQRLKHQNAQLRMTIHGQLPALKQKCDALLKENNKKTNIISSLEARLGIALPTPPRQTH